MEKPHVFLTGDRQVGKSFLLKRVLQEIDVPLSGFLTKWEDTKDGANLYLKDAAGNNLAVLATRDAACSKMTVYLPVFETAGTASLENLEGLVLMDELGKFESKAPTFSEAVFRVLDSDMPVFGVVRDSETEFLDAVRSHPKTQTIRVTMENRDALYFEVRQILKEILQDRK